MTCEHRAVRIALGVLAVAFVACFMLAGAIIAGLLGSTKARAHDWFLDKRNPRTLESCCYGESRPPADQDCQPLEIDDWSYEGDAFVFVWPKDGKRYRFPRADALPSQDRRGRAAACVLNGRVRCFFLPTTG